MSYTNATFYIDLEGGSDAARTALTSVAVANNGSGAVRCTKAGHGLVDGAVVDNTINYTGAWIVDVIDANTFDLVGSTYSTATALTATPRGGSSKADAWKTITGGATSARHAAGDTIRIMASPDETLVGNATWTNLSKTVTLAGAVTASVDDCEIGWMAAPNVTCTGDVGVFKMGSSASRFVIASGFTTGMAAYITLPGTINEALDVGAHRYWRLVITANNGDTNFANFGELELIDATDVDQTGSGTATADSAQSAATWPVSNLFNNVTTDFFAFGTGYTHPHWVAYDFGSGVTKNIVKFKITSGIAGGATAAQQPKDFALQYSDDGVAWTTSWDESGATGWTAETRTYTKPTVDSSVAKDFSGYQQVSFWIQNSVAIADGATLSLRLCSDIAGLTTVNTIAIPAIASSGQWVPVTVNTGAALGSSIRSVALYCDKDPGAITLYLDNIIVCKAATSADSLSLTSLIGKEWNRCWSASTVYAANDIRKPSQPNRNGYRYMVTAGGGGSSGSSEPAWPKGIGSTVADGALTWTCEGLEDTYYGIQSISGTTVKLDNNNNTIGTGGRGYCGTTETVATYKREVIKYATMVAQSFNNAPDNYMQRSGTHSAWVTYSGGWNRTDMSTQTGETWTTGQNGYGQAIYLNSATYVNIENFSSVRFYRGIQTNATTQVVTIRNCHHNNTGFTGLDTNAGRGVVYGFVANNGACLGIDANTAPHLELNAVTCNNHVGNFPQSGLRFTTGHRVFDLVARNNVSYGLTSDAGVVYPHPDSVLRNVVTSDNGSGSAQMSGGGIFVNSSFAEATTFTGLGNLDVRIQSHQHGQVAGSHLITMTGGTIVSATDQRHTASGLAWKFRPTAASRTSSFPLRLPLARKQVTANVAVGVTIWCRRSSTDIKGALRILGGQIAGVPDTVSVACEPTINTWVQSSTLTFTPTEDGVVEIVFDVWDGINTTMNFWVDDLAFS